MINWGLDLYDNVCRPNLISNWLRFFSWIPSVFRCSGLFLAVTSSKQASIKYWCVGYWSTHKNRKPHKKRNTHNFFKNRNININSKTFKIETPQKCRNIWRVHINGIFNQFTAKNASLLHSPDFCVFWRHPRFQIFELLASLGRQYFALSAAPAENAGKKKLIVDFHFEYKSNCDSD